MKKQEMIIRSRQLAKNQEKIEEIFIRNQELDRAEVAHTKRIMYENFAELLENWLDEEVKA